MAWHTPQDAVRPLVFLARFPDLQIQRAAACAIAGLALGKTGEGKQCSKIEIIRKGAVRPLAELVKYPDVEIQASQRWWPAESAMVVN